MFCSSQDFVDLILRQFHRTDEFVPRRKLANLVRVLLHQLLADNPHSNAVQKIQSFAEENEGEEFASPLRYHIDVSQRDASAGAAPRTSSLWAARPHDTSLPPVLLVDPSTPITSLGQVSPQELARQMTLLQAQAFQKLRTREYAYWMRARLSMHDVVYRHRLRDPVHRRKMGHLLDVVARFCGTVHWLRLELTQHQSNNDSVNDATLRYLFAFARELLRVNNLQGLAAVVLVLADHFAALRRLLTPAEFQELADIVLLFHSPCGGGHDVSLHHHDHNEALLIEGAPGAFQFSHSTRRHRDILFNAQSSVLPFVMPYLDGLQIIMQGGSSFAADDGDGDGDGDDDRRPMVSLQKMERASLVLRLVQQYQHRTYAFEPVDNIRAFVERRLQEGVWSMALRPLADLCREVVWAHRIDYRPQHLPQELVQFLDRSHLPMGDVLYVLNNL